MELHIGNLLTQYFEQHRTRKAALARKMGVSAPVVMQLQKKESIQLKTLLQLSEILQHNFLLDIAQQLPADYTTAYDIFAEKSRTIASLQEEVKKLTIERDLLLMVKAG